MEPERLLDEAGAEILRALQENARVSFAELSRKLGMSAPAITDRVRKMEEAGIISGYHARVNPAKVGFPVTALVHLITSQEHFPAVITLARETPELRECHRVSDGDAFVLRFAAASGADLDRVVSAFSHFGPVRTWVVLSTPVEK